MFVAGKRRDAQDITARITRIVWNLAHTSIPMDDLERLWHWHELCSNE